MQRTTLVKTLELIAPSLASSGLVPVFGCFMFNGDTISAFNGDSLAIEAAFENKGGFAVEGKVLLGLLQNSRAEKVEMAVEKNDVRITSGKSKAKLPYVPEDEFLFEKPDDKAEATYDFTWVQDLEVCLSTTCRDNSMPALMGITFTYDPQLTLYSCDGDAITSVDPKSKSKGKGSFTAPNSFCEALIKIWHETQPVSGQIEFSSNWAKATLSTGFTLYGRVIKSPIDHAALIEKTMTGEMPFVGMPEGLDEALARARVLADAESKPTIMTVSNGKLGLLTESKLGEAREDLPMKGHDDVEAFVHAQLVQRSINICDQISIRENCTCYQLGDKVLQVVSNIGA